MYQTSHKYPSKNKPTQLQSSQLAPTPAVQAQKKAIEPDGDKLSWVQRMERAAQSGFNIADIPISSPQTIQRHSEPAGLPAHYKEAGEKVLNKSLDGYRFYPNSKSPAKLGALAFKQGKNIYGPLEHLGHELGHTGQENQLKNDHRHTVEVNGYKINTNQALERDADSKGAKIEKEASKLKSQDRRQQQAVQRQQLQQHSHQAANQHNTSRQTSVGAKPSDSLQAKSDNLWVQRMEQASQSSYNIANIPISSPHKQDLVVQSKSAIQTKPIAGKQNNDKTLAYEKQSEQQGAVPLQRSPQKNETENQSKTVKTASSLSRQSAIEGKVVQCYKFIRSDSNEYPIKKKSNRLGKDKEIPDDKQFFVSQEEKDGSYLSNNQDETKTYTPNLVYESSVDLMVADNYDLAIETTGKNQAKVFFATDEKIDEGNKALKGKKVKLRKTGRYLQITNGNEINKKLYKVEPFVEQQKAAGVDVRTPQRCNDMADFVTGKYTLGGTEQVYLLIASILEKLAEDNDEIKSNNYLKKLDDIKNKKDITSEQKRNEYGRFLDEIGDEFRRFRRSEDKYLSSLDDMAKREMQIDKIMENKKVNEYMDPVVGDAIMIGTLKTRKEESEAKEAGEIQYHFGSVVAKSGSDYITMENYARNDTKNKDKLSQGDPLFYFQMYGSYRLDREQTWHEKNLGNFSGAIISIVVK